MRGSAIRAGVLACLSVGCLAPGSVVAQEAASPEGAGAQAPVQSAPVAPVLMLDQDRLFSESRFGRALQADLDAEAAALLTESRRIDAALEEEERSLTARRAAMSPEEFRAAADDFDRRVEELRGAQEAKSRALTRRRDADRQRFFQAAVPVLGQMMAEAGALVLLDKDSVILSFEGIDLTDAAIARMDVLLGDGSATPEAPPAQPATADPAQPAAP